MSPASETLSPQTRTVRALLAALVLPLSGIGASYVAWGLPGATGFAVLAAAAACAQEWLTRQASRRAPTGVLGQSIDASESNLEQADPSESARLLAHVHEDLQGILRRALDAGDTFLDTDLSPTQREAARSLRAELGEAMSCVLSALEYCALEGGEVLDAGEVFEVRPLLEGAFDTLQGVARRRDRDLLYLVEADVPRSVLGDRGATDRAIRHLVRHALEAPGEGELLVTVRAVRAGGMSESLDLVLQIRGVDVASEAASEMGRTDLDVAIARRLVERMGGGIERCEDEAGRAELRAWMRVEGCGTERGVDPVTGGSRLLVAGGSSAARVALAEYGRQLGLESHALGGSADALRRILEDPSLASDGTIVLYAASEGDLPAEEFGRRVREATRESRPNLLLVHDSHRETTPRLWVRAGFDAWIAKPVGPRRLASGVRQALLAGRTEMENPAESSSRRPALDTPKRSVLLVEDNIVNQKVAGVLLGKLGCRVVHARHGGEAVERAMEETFDFVLMDCQMPVMDGFEAARRIRALADTDKRNVPIIALTEDTSEENRERCFSAGMNDFLSKPVQQDTLSRVLTTWTHTNRDIMTSHPEEDGRKHDAPTLDQATLEGLRALDEPGEQSLLEELVRLFLDDTPVRMEDLERAFESADAESLSRAAHALKSSAANLGALRLSEMFKELETAGRQGAIDNVDSLIREVREEYGRVQVALEEEVG